MKKSRLENGLNGNQDYATVHEAKKSIPGSLLRPALSRILICLSLFMSLSFFPSPGLAVQEEGEGAFYIVQEGDSLWDIAQRFRVSVDNLSRTNNITDPGQLSVGQQLLIPGLTGYNGELITRTILYGDSLRSLSRLYQVPRDLLVRLNHLTSPADFYVGTPLVLPQENSGQVSRRAMLLPGQSTFELAILNDVNPWSLVLENYLENSLDAMPGDVVHMRDQESSQEAQETPSAIPEFITRIDLSSYPFIQGKVAEVKIAAELEISLGGTLNDHSLNFFPYNDGYVSLQGIHAMVDPGLYPLEINGTLPDEHPYPGARFAFSQPVLIRRGNYPFDPTLTVSPETIDPAVTGPEDAIWSSLAAPITPEKSWEGVFLSPAPEPFSQCWPSTFGNRRSYNGSAYSYFHTGLDFCGGVGIEIHAPAHGKVVFAGPLTVRGNATMIDHGWGVYSGYMHQSEILVQVGDLVEPGQIIGLVGGTGRVTGPHLHWEVWVGGVQVDPLDWLQQIIPLEPQG